MTVHGFNAKGVRRIIKSVEYTEKHNRGDNKQHRRKNNRASTGFWAVITDQGTGDDKYKYSWEQLEPQEDGELEPNDEWLTGDCQETEGYAIEVNKSEGVSKGTKVFLRPSVNQAYYIFSLTNENVLLLLAQPNSAPSDGIVCKGRTENRAYPIEVREVIGEQINEDGRLQLIFGTGDDAVENIAYNMSYEPITYNYSGSPMGRVVRGVKTKFGNYHIYKDELLPTARYAIYYGSATNYTGEGTFSLLTGSGSGGGQSAGGGAGLMGLTVEDGWLVATRPGVRKIDIHVHAGITISGSSDSQKHHQSVRTGYNLNYFSSVTGSTMLLHTDFYITHPAKSVTWIDGEGEPTRISNNASPADGHFAFRHFFNVGDKIRLVGQDLFDGDITRNDYYQMVVSGPASLEGWLDNYVS